MIYRKRLADAEDLDALRINLSAQPKKLSSEPVCDFCGRGNGVWLYGAKRMSTGESRPCWRWLACAECAALIDGERHEELMQRTASHPMFGGFPAALVAEAVRQAWQVFDNDAVREREA